MSLTLTSVHRYPVKSCRGESVHELLVEPWGLAGDRRWMLVDEAGAAITAREVNRLVLIHPAITPDGLVVSAPDLPALTVSTPDPGAQMPVNLWESHLTAAPAGPEADAWFSKAMGRTARLVHLDDPTRRPTSPDFSEPGDRVSLADGYPLLLATEESLAALNDVVLERSTDAREPLPMTRFRPNFVVAGRRGLGRGRLAPDPHRRRDLPRGQGLRPLRADHHRPGDRPAREGADRLARPGAGAGTARPGSGSTWCPTRPTSRSGSATRSRCSTPYRPATGRSGRALSIRRRCRG